MDDAVKFTTGRVVSIQRVKNRRVKRGEPEGVIRMILRPPDLPYSEYTALVKYAPRLKLRDRNDQGSRFDMPYFQGSGDGEICRVVYALKAKGYLTRHQEIEAYATFEIPYSPDVKS